MSAPVASLPRLPPLCEWCSAMRAVTNRIAWAIPYSDGQWDHDEGCVDCTPRIVRYARTYAAPEHPVVVTDIDLF